MSEQDSTAKREVRGTIRRRLLVNATVDPDEAASRLPAGLRPHVTELGTVVGCCLLEIERIRPARVPAAAGRTLRAAAHRISVEWDDGAGTTVGVYVPVRHSDSRLAVALGGLWFPGIHQRASIDIAEAPGQLRWVVSDAHGAGGFGIQLTVAIPPPETPESTSSDHVGGTCLSATIGLSPDRRGALEGAKMDPDHRLAREVTVLDLTSGFLSGFTTARPARSYMMRDVDVTWTPATAPELTIGLARA